MEVRLALMIHPNTLDGDIYHRHRFITLDILLGRALTYRGARSLKVTQALVRSLVRTVYRSKSTLHPDNVEELDKIFKTAVKNNRRRNLSGCLAHPDGHFVQVIEGDVEAVDSLMSRLIADPRHEEVIVLGRWATPSRIFASWAMARPDLRPLAEQSLRLINEKGSGAQVTALLLSLVDKGTWLYPLI